MIEFGYTAIKPKSVECCSDVCPSVSYIHIWLWSQLEEVSCLFQMYSIKSNRDYMLLLPFNEAEFSFWTLSQMCGLMQTCFWALQTVLLTPGLGFCSDMHYQLLELLLRRVCLSKSYPFNWICHRLPSLKV